MGMCSHCNKMGHLASECPQKRREEREAAAQKRRQEREEREATRQKTYCYRVGKDHEVKRDDEGSVHSESTMASHGDMVCGFCGMKRTAPKSKKCKDRCQSCFRKF